MSFLELPSPRALARRAARAVGYGAVVAFCATIGTCSEPPSLLEKVRARGALRVVTRNAPTTYYLGPDGPIGPEYELASRFAASIGVDLELYTVDAFGDLLPELLSRRADIAAAHLTVTPPRQELVRFGPPYQEVSQYIVYKRGTLRPRTVEDLAGKQVEVVAGSSYVETLVELQQLHPELEWVEVDTSLEDLLARVSAGELDHTVTDSTSLALNRRYYPEVRRGFALKEADRIAWAFRPGHDHSLYGEAVVFFARMRIYGELDDVLARYYEHTQRFDYVGTRRFIEHLETRLPDYRALFEEAAAETGFEWRLLAAVAYQESHWNPRAVSPTGVRGLMMLTRATAAALDIEDRTDPRQSIVGGAHYLRRVKDKMPERIGEPDRTWLALAAYNVGFGHLEDARILTELNGKNPDRWADVREHLPLLSDPKWYRKVKRGYARGREPVLYVRNIRSYYDILLWLVPDEPSEDEALPEEGPDTVPDDESEDDVDETLVTRAAAAHSLPSVAE